MRKYVISVAVLAICAVALAGYRESAKITVAGANGTISSGINGEAITDSPVSDAMSTIDPIKTQLALGITVSAGSTTGVDVSCEWSPDKSSWFPHMSCEYDSAGNYDCVAASWSFAVAAGEDAHYVTMLLPAYGQYSRCSFTGSGTSEITVIGTMTEF